MKNNNLPTIFCAFMLVSSLLIEANGQSYASKETETVVKKMIAAHGGYEAWKDLKTLSFSNIMHSESLPTLRFWTSSNTYDMKTRRSYQDWPIHQSYMSFDGKEAWSIDWRVGNSPKYQHSVFFYYVNLPWLTQDSNVKLGQAVKITHEAYDNPVYKVEMGFTEPPTEGKSVNDTYTLFIDSESYLLAGYEYTVSWGPLLDLMRIPKGEVFGPVRRKNNLFSTEENGLRFPVLMTTSNVETGELYGDHVLYNYVLDGDFDESRMIKPPNAIVDTVTDVRKN
ncbi:MAG: hypothetical protein ABJP45_17750 [Cyclobacteriaceae bacterium]